ncbi:hypothetical protein NB694_000345 [Pantoea ananatis]|uniref:hypothetical protein n=1 Tax=Pantoea ananas TaxID=553 RepID=UPI0021F76815|nr:hypothetical protein [Pantoea ananatis]MCW0310545.1 hypothetical protein [Pantoea ananatis]
MISICSSINTSYYRSDVSLSKALLFAFPHYAALTRLMMASAQEKRAKTFSLEKRHREFNFNEIEDAFNCEFVPVPDEINSAEDFRKWILEMKFE